MSAAMWRFSWGWLAALLGTSGKKMQLIVDTDIGLDIDDAWALSSVLASPDLFDLRLVTTVSGDTEERAQIVSKFLTLAGRTDVPIGVGMPTNISFPQDYLAEWARDSPLKNYSGHVGYDAPALMAEAVSEWAQPVILAIGPLTNLALFATRYPRLARRTRVYAMAGSVDRGYANATRPAAEYNVRTDVAAAQAVFRRNVYRSWVVVPLDTCGLVQLTGDRYQRLLVAAPHPSQRLLGTLLSSFEAWYRSCSRDERLPGCSRSLQPYNPGNGSSGLFDVIPALLARWDEAPRMHPKPLRQVVEMEPISLCVTDTGFTVRQPANVTGCAPTHVALRWAPGGLETVMDNIVSTLAASHPWPSEKPPVLLVYS